MHICLAFILHIFKSPSSVHALIFFRTEDEEINNNIDNSKKEGQKKKNKQLAVEKEVKTDGVNTPVFVFYPSIRAHWKLARLS